MAEKTSLKQIAFLSLMPILLLLLIQSYLVFLHKEAVVSPFILSFLTAQLLSNLVFIKGEICMGQRGRLITSYYFFAVFWLVQLLLSDQQSYLLLISLCGLSMIALVAYHKKRPFLVSISSIIGALAILIYLFWLFSQTNLILLMQTPFIQLFVGVILLNFALLVAKNRLQGFIALLPFVMAILLVLNIFTLLFSLNSIQLNNLYAMLIYFVLHLVLMSVLMWHIFTKNKLNYMALTLLLFIAASLPVWFSFAQFV